MSETCINSAIFVYLLALVLLITGNRPKLNRILVILGISLHLLGVLIRGFTTHHLEIIDIYGSILFLTLLIMLRWSISEHTILPALRSFMLFFILIILLTVQLLPQSFRALSNLPPAVYTTMAYLHISAYMFGYMALFFASFYAFGILFSARADNSTEIVELGRRLDHEARLALFFLNLGLITGAVWAFEYRGSYWSGDSKETWALINILLLGGYFHLVKLRNYKKAMVIVLTVFSVVFTFIGVNFLMNSWHSWR